MKKSKLFLLFAVLMAVFTGFQSCGSDDDTFEVSVSKLTFESEVFEKTFSIKSDIAWTITSDATWCKVSSASGSGDATIVVTVEENESVIDPRSAKLTLTAEGFSPVTISVNQLARDSKSPEVKETAINVTTSWGTWNYFSFAQGKIVGTGTADADSDAEWKLRTDWDIAFTRLYARTNSGVSGDGQGGIIEISADETDKAKVFADLEVAPKSGYVLDAVVEDMMTAMPPVYYNAGGCAAINSWLTLAMPVVVVPKVFVLKTADGKYVKVHLRGYQNDLGASGYIDMQYAYQPDGSTNLMTE